MKKSKRALLDEAEKALSDAYRLMRIHEKIWEEQWAAAANPFIAFEEHKKNTPQRVALVSAWLKAKDTYNNLRD